MDRNDARFVADSIDSLINGDRESLDLIATTQLVRAMRVAGDLRRAAADWQPAVQGAAALEGMVRHGAAFFDGEGISQPWSNLIILVDKMRELAGEPPSTRPIPRNRAERRAQTGFLPRVERVA